MDFFAVEQFWDKDYQNDVNIIGTKGHRQFEERGNNTLLFSRSDTIILCVGK